MIRHESGRSGLLQQGLEAGQPVLRRHHLVFLGQGVALVQAHLLDETRYFARNAIACPFAFLAPGKRQAALRTRNANIHEPAFLFDALHQQRLDATLEILRSLFS